MKTIIISTYIPQQCGIATFTHDLYKNLDIGNSDTVHIAAVSKDNEIVFLEEVVYCIEKENLKSYIHAADFINSHYDLCIIQHEYGIFGGSSGEYIITLCRLLHIPIITNFHTILPSPSLIEKKILCELGHISTKVTVMTQMAVNMLNSIYQIPFGKVHMIPHGVPVFDYNQLEAKKKLGLIGKKVLLSFGFLGRNKGIEVALEAIKNVNDKNFIYLILGVTHPNVLKHEGELYREALIQKCRELGISDKVKFINQFVTNDILVDYLSACDMYVTPYPNENQISSGTLSYALGAGAVVISTPYLYAKDLLSENRGILFDFNDSTQLAKILNHLIDNSDLLKEYRYNSRQHGQSMQWPIVGKRYSNLIANTFTTFQKLHKPA